LQTAPIVSALRGRLADPGERAGCSETGMPQRSR
jgi:hypothetical protein